MGVYDSQIAMAARLIRERGKPVSIIKLSTATTPDKPWEPTTPATTTIDGHAVFLNFNQKDLETQSKMAGASEIKASDRKVILSASELSDPPTTNDQLEDESGRWSIEWVQVLSPNGENIIYTLRVRQ